MEELLKAEIARLEKRFQEDYWLYSVMAPSNSAFERRYKTGKIIVPANHDELDRVLRENQCICTGVEFLSGGHLLRIEFYYNAAFSRMFLNKTQP